MGRRKNSLNNLDSNAFHAYADERPFESTYPTLHKVLNSNEMHMFDLVSVQAELESMLSNVMERLLCLYAESKGKNLPENISNLIKHREGARIQDSSSGRPSLVVKPNPDKPLSLIISQQTRPTQQFLPAPDLSSNRKKFPPNSPCAARVNKSSTEEPIDQGANTSPDKNQPASSYAIPNKFWELMEPYCAEITEANISYLEGLIRSYQDVESSFLQTPISHSTGSLSYTDAVHSPAAKRPRRETTGLPQHRGTDTDQVPDASVKFKLEQNSRIIEAELRRPPNENTAFGRLSRSLLDSCYRENVVFSFTEGVRHFSQEAGIPNSTIKPEDQNEVGSSSCSLPSSEESKPTDKEGILTASASDAFPVLTDEIRRALTMKASQPLKTLAKQMHINSSYRVEKKIAQAMDELGLIPLKVTHHAPLDSFKTNDIDSMFSSVFRSDIPSSSKEPCGSVHRSSSEPFSPQCQNKQPTDSISLRSFSGKRRRSNSLRSLRSPSSITKLNSDTTSCHPVNSVKLEDSDYSSMNGLSEGGQTMNDRNSRKSGRSGGYSRMLRSHQSETVQQNGYDTSINQSDSPQISRASQSKVVPDALVNGSCFTEDEDEEVDKEAIHEPNQSSISKVTVNLASLKRTRTESMGSPKVNSCLPSDAMEFNHLNSPAQCNGDIFTFDHLVHQENDSSAQTTAGKTAPECTVGETEKMELVDSKPTPSSGTLNRDHEKPADRKFDNAFFFLLREFGLGSSSIQSAANLQSYPNRQSSPSVTLDPSDEVALAIHQRQQELRLVCAENHAVLRRLVQAARRDMQRQEIQRRLAVADADVIEAYNKLESYRPQRKPPLKRDRDCAYKALKERRKILKELEAFDAKSP